MDKTLVCGTKNGGPIPPGGTFPGDRSKTVTFFETVQKRSPFFRKRWVHPSPVFVFVRAMFFRLIV